MELQREGARRESRPTPDPDSEWRRLKRKGRNEYDLDDISSAVMIEAVDRLLAERQEQSKSPK